MTNALFFMLAFRYIAYPYNKKPYRQQIKMKQTPKVVLIGIAGLITGILVMYFSAHFLGQAKEKQALLAFSLLVTVPVAIKGLKQMKPRS